MVLGDPVFLIITAPTESAIWVLHVNIQRVLVDCVITITIAPILLGVNRQYLVLDVIMAMETIAPAAVNANLSSLNVGVGTNVRPRCHLVRFVTETVTVSQVRACLFLIYVYSQRMASCQASNFIYLF
jgi:hypothetical protein